MPRTPWEIIYKPPATTPQETICVLYYEQGKSLREVSKILGVHRKALSFFMERNKMARRLSQRQRAEKRREIINKRRKT